MGFQEDSLPTIPEYYKGKTIFITGGSGFMGKVLVEKLLYSCTDLDRIYLLLRNKKGVKAEDRLAALYASDCFSRLKAEKPGAFESKVFVIAGDVMDEGLGLSEEDRTLIINRVNIIFHVAASVRFDDPMKYAAKLNLRGTKEVVDLAREIRDLSSLVHVSTSYSNTNRDPIEETMYPPHADWKELLSICENLDEQSLRVLTPKYLGEIPNTYTFTKQLAEHVVYEQRGTLPAVIIRPSIVISSINEPVPGWIENFNGPVGILVACGKGIMRSLYSDPDLISDYMPCDIAIKSFIVAGWLRGTQKLQATDDIPIYNCCASRINYITMGELVQLGKKIVEEVPLEQMLWTVGGDITRSKTVHYIKVIILHLLPALFVDTLLWLLGKKTMLVKLQRRIYIANIALRYYVTKQWTFANSKFVSLRYHIKEQDKEHFFYDMENVDKHGYFKSCVLAAKEYLLKEKIDADIIEKARAHYRKMLIVDQIIRCIFYGYLFYWFVNCNFVQNILISLYTIIFT